MNTHQDTGILLFPLVSMQFFSSGLIMVGDTDMEAVVLTMGRDLWVSESKYDFKYCISQCDQCLLYFRTIRNNIPVQNCLINAKGTNDEI